MSDEKYKIGVKATAFRGHNVDYVEIETDIIGNLSREILNLKDQVVRKALIDLGWTPPQQ